MQTRKKEILVGTFLLLALLAALFICLKVADITSIGAKPSYRIYATFNNVGDLKIHSPVRIGGVIIGRVSKISLDEKRYLPCVTIDIEERYNHIPNTSSLSVLTAGLLGEQYLSLNVGFKNTEFGTQFLSNGDIIQDTKSAIALEDIIGQLLYSNRRHR